MKRPIWYAALPYTKRPRASCSQKAHCEMDMLCHIFWLSHLLHDERAGEARRRVVQLPRNILGQLPRSLPGAGKNARIGARHGLCSDTLGGELAQLGIPNNRQQQVW